MINIALLGFGVVGSGSAEVIEKNEKLISARLGDKVYIKYILDRRDLSDTPYADRVVGDIDIILRDPEVSIVGEMLGGVHPAVDFTRACLEAGKTVVTSNKAVVAAEGDSLLELARQKGVRYLFEASVGGGIPIIRPLIDELSDNEITFIAGILNGTTNYILTQMAQSGVSFDDVLHRAQQLGYAEADPSADVDGFDAARKIAILSAISYGKLLPFESLYVRGIRNVTSVHTALASKLGGSVKLTAYAEKTPNGRIYASVSPRLVMPSCPLCHIDDVFNGVLVCGNMLGEAMFYGKGAGKLPTASAVVSDIIDAAERPNIIQQRLEWTRADENSIFPNSEYACKRMIIAKHKCGEKASLFEKSDADYELDGTVFSAYLTKELTDTEVADIIEKLGSSFDGEYRIIE